MTDLKALADLARRVCAEPSRRSGSYAQGGPPVDPHKPLADNDEILRLASGVLELLEEWVACPACGEEWRRKIGVEVRVDTCAERDAALRERDEARAAWQQVIADVIATRMWRRGGMRPSTDTSPFSSLPPSVLRDMERRARTALARHEPADEGCPVCGETTPHEHEIETDDGS